MKTLRFIAALLLPILLISCGPPTVTTTAITNITATSASSGGNVTECDNDTTRGVVWDTAPNPTISLSTQTHDGKGVGTYISAITGLKAGTKYYVRAYATNSDGTGYGEEVSFTTSPAAPTSVVIGAQTWSTKNLDVTTYRDGTPIPEVQDQAQWQTQTAGAWCYYNNDPANAVYGKLYNWYAVNNTKGLAPAGWHIPSRAEWETLENNFGGLTNAGGPLKETGTTHWAAPNTNASNSTGFTGLPGGWRTDGGFAGLTERASFWATTVSAGDANRVWQAALFYNTNNLGSGTNVKVFGCSVRCIKD